MTAQVLRRKEVVSCSSPDGLNPRLRAVGIVASVCLPLSVQDRILGVLYVHFRQPHTFSPQERHLLSLFANQCAMAIARTQYAEQIRVHASVAWMGIDLSEMTHDIGKAATRMQDYLYLLRRRVEGDETARELLASAESALGELIEITYRELQLGPELSERVDLVELLTQGLERWCAAHDRIQREVRAVPTGPMFVMCNPKRIAMVIKNLLQNAVSAANEVGDPRISLAIANKDRYVEVTFTNSGRQIPPERREQLFRGRVTSASGGRGVGLVIARSIASGYSGDLELVDSTDQETTFRLTLPLALNDMPGTEPSNEADHIAGRQ